MRFVLFLMTLVLIGFQSQAAREVRNGGGGLHIEGRYLTYYSAHGKVQQAVEMAEAIPGLDLLIREIISLPLNREMKLGLLTVIDASAHRRYYRIAGDALDPELREKLISDYSELYKVPKDQVVIFAVTNTEDRSTVLLPEFYALSPTEQAAMIVHETMWLGGSSVEYSDVIRSEQYTQAYFENKSSPQWLFPFLDILKRIYPTDHNLKIKAGLAFDLKHKRFPAEVLETNRLLLKDFLGEKFAKAILCTPQDVEERHTIASSISLDLYYEMRFNYEAKKSSLFYSGIADTLQEGSVIAKSEGKFNCAREDVTDKTFVNLEITESGPKLNLELVDSRGAHLGNLEIYF